MFRLIVSGILFIFASQSFAKDIYIFEARRPLSLQDNVRLPKDFYINAGTEAGLRSDVVVTVTRRTSFYDPYQNKSAGDIKVPVAQLRIIYSQDGMSVARLEKMFGRAYLPGIDIPGVLIGDRLDMGSAKKQSRKNAFRNPVQRIPVSGAQPASEINTGQKQSSAEFSSLAPPIPQSNVTLDSQTL